MKFKSLSDIVVKAVGVEGMHDKLLYCKKNNNNLYTYMKRIKRRKKKNKKKPLLYGVITRTQFHILVISHEQYYIRLPSILIAVIRIGGTRWSETLNRRYFFGMRRQCRATIRSPFQLLPAADRGLVVWAGQTAAHEQSLQHQIKPK